MRSVAVIPIKLNNERAPGKNTRPLPDSSTLLSRVLGTMTSITELDEVVVFCSDDRIKPEVERWGARFLARDPELDLPSATSNDILAAFASLVPADVYALAHATSPFVEVESIRKGLGAVLDGTHDSAFSVRRSHDFVWLNGAPLNFDPSRIPRTQDLDPLFVETSAFYIFTSAVLLAHGRRVGFTPLLVEQTQVEAVDVDDEDDFAIASALIRSGVVR